MRDVEIGARARVVRAFALLLGVVALAGAALAVWSIAARSPAVAPEAVGTDGDPTAAVAGTAGVSNAGAVGVSDEGLPLGALGSIVGDAHTIAGREDLTEYIGMEVVVVADVGRVVNDVAFWVGTSPRDILVVPDRDVRANARDTSAGPSGSPLGPLPHGVATFIGRVAPVPHAEAAYSWGLTRREVEALAERGVFVRLYDVLTTAPEIPGAVTPPEAIDEFGRETAPPPGDEVQTPVPPPRP